MNRYDRLYLQFSGISLIVAPLLMVVAALIDAANIGTTSGRWYDNWLGGTVQFLGFALFIIASLALSRIVGQKQPRLGIVTATLGIMGGAATMFPAMGRIMGSGAVEVGISLEQLDLLFNGTDISARVLVMVLLLGLFFLNLLLLSLGLSRVKEIARYTPVLLATGAVLLFIAQSSSEGIVAVYIASTLAWLLALAPVGVGLLRSDETIAFAYDRT